MERLSIGEYTMNKIEKCKKKKMSKKDIINTITEIYGDLLWLGRTSALIDDYPPNVRSNVENTVKNILSKIDDNKGTIRDFYKYGCTDFEWGEISGVVETLRFVNGSDWRNLDS